MKKIFQPELIKRFSLLRGRLFIVVLWFLIILHALLGPNSLRILLLIRSDFLIFLLLRDVPLIIAVVLTALHIAIDVEEFSSNRDPATLGHISPISRCERIGFYLLLIVLVSCIWRFLLCSLRTGSLWLLPVFLNKFPFLF